MQNRQIQSKKLRQMLIKPKTQTKTKIQHNEND
jgi:hypothetical protein